MTKGNWIERLFRKSVGECPSRETLIAFARNREVSKKDADHISVCPQCQKEIEVIKEDDE